MERSRIIAVVAVVLVAAIVISVVCVLVSNSTPKCAPVKTIPDVTKEEPKVASASDFKTLVKFSGFLEYDKDTFVPLELEKVDDTPDNVATFGMNCATLKLDWKINNNYYQIDKVTVDLVTANGDSKTCSLSNIAWNVKTDFYYSCAKPMAYDCLDDKTKQKSIVHIAQLEFELAGDPVKIKNNEFSRKPSVCT